MEILLGKSDKKKKGADSKKKGGLMQGLDSPIKGTLGTIGGGGLDGKKVLGGGGLGGLAPLGSISSAGIADRKPLPGISGPPGAGAASVKPIGAASKQPVTVKVINLFIKHRIRNNTNTYSFCYCCLRCFCVWLWLCVERGGGNDPSEVLPERPQQRP